MMASADVGCKRMLPGLTLRASRSGTSKRWRQFHPERLLEQLHVAEVLFSRDVTLGVTAHLSLRGKALNPCAVDGAHSCEGVGREHPVIPVVHPMDCRAVGPDGHRMKVDLVARRAGQPERVWNRSLSNDEVRWPEQFQSLRNVAHADDDVEIIVRTRLTPEQRIDPPATVYPDRNASLLQLGDEPADGRCIHDVGSLSRLHRSG